MKNIIGTMIKTATRISMSDLEYIAAVDELRDIVDLVLTSEYDTLGYACILDIDGIYELCDESHWNEGSYHVYTFQIADGIVYNETRKLDLDEINDLIRKIDNLINCKEVNA